MRMRERERKRMRMRERERKRMRMRERERKRMRERYIKRRKRRKSVCLLCCLHAFLSKLCVFIFTFLRLFSRPVFDLVFFFLTLP